MGPKVQSVDRGVAGSCSCALRYATYAMNWIGCVVVKYTCIYSIKRREKVVGGKEKKMNLLTKSPGHSVPLTRAEEKNANEYKQTSSEYESER